MTEPTLARVAQVLRGALDQADATRAAWVERECAGDTALHVAVRRLIELDACSGLALDQPLDGIAAQLFAPSVDAATVDRRVGAFRLLRKLGEGGMGTVWLAERVDGGFAQQVALKLIRLGMDSTTVQAQFRRERELLAQLAHADIARLLDGGVDAQGRPWFAMEYVAGTSLRDWLDSSRPDLRTRLALFLRLARAVAYAHAHLIVHRDLKPSNVLVRADVSPCLLDFGIARLIAEEGTEDAGTTAQRFVTRAYAAPEQLRGEPVTTATDVYALGALMFELLTGLRYSGQRKSEGAITRPSAALARADIAPLAVAPAQLRGDLDAIVLRALAEEPPRRYTSAEALAEDVENFLAGRAVKARPDGRMYRAGKWLRRNRLAAVAIAAAVFALVAGSGVSVWQGQRAQHMAQRAERGKDFLLGLLQDADPFEAPAGRSAPPDQLLDNAIARLDRDFADAPEVQMEMRVLIEHNLLRTGKIAKAQALAQANVKSARWLHGADSPQLGVALIDDAQAIEDSGDNAAARRAFAAALALLDHAGAGYARPRIAAMTGLAKLDNIAGDHAAAHERHIAIWREREALEGPQSPDIAMDLMNLAADAIYSENYAEAETLALRAHAMATSLLGPEHARMIYVDNVLGLARLEAGHTTQALSTMHEVVRRARTTLSADAPMLGSVLATLGYAQLEAGDYAAALVSLDQARAIAAAHLHPLRGRVTLHLGLAQAAAGHAQAPATLRMAVEELQGTPGGYREWAQAALGAALARAGDAASGEKMMRAARSDLLAGKDAGCSRLGEVDELLADLLAARGQAAEAQSLRSEALTVFRRIYGPDHPRTRQLVEAVDGKAGTLP